MIRPTAPNCQSRLGMATKFNRMAVLGETRDQTYAVMMPTRTSGTQPPSARTGHALRQFTPHTHHATKRTSSTTFNTVGVYGGSPSGSDQSINVLVALPSKSGSG